MKKLLLSLLILVSFITCLFGQEVDKETIKTVALNASRSYNPSSEDSIKISKILPISREINNIGYIVNFSDNSLVILSGDYSIQPVLGHSLNGPFSWDNVPPGLDYLLRKYEAGIKYSREHHLKPTLETAELWQALKKNYVSNNSTKSSVDPLMDTKWDQSPDFNYFCPEDDESIYSNDKCPAGCSAIALSQILKFWSCRVDPQGSNSYSSDYGTLSVNFSTQTYDWDNMNDTIGDLDNAWLIYSVGVSMDMDYGPDGSGTTDSKIEYALNNYWGFSNADVKGRISHLLTWKGDLKNELNAGRPILYGGYADIWFNGGHSWVIDGYNSDDRFLCNWGWGGYLNGPFSLGDFNPGAHDFNEWESAIFGAYPDREAGPINGDDTICYGSNESYILNCCPTGASVSWSKSSNLNWVGTPSGTNCTATASSINSAGTGWVKATVTKTDNSVIYITKDVWVGKPLAPTTNPTGASPYSEIEVGTYKYVYLVSTLGANPSNTGNWSATGHISTSGSTSGEFHSFYGASEGMGAFYVTTTNTCGTSIARQGGISVIDDGGGDPPPPVAPSGDSTQIQTPNQILFDIYPNPTQSKVCIDIIKNKPNGHRSENIEIKNTPYIIRVYDFQMNLEKQLTSKGELEEIDLSELIPGQYLIQVQKGKKVSTKIIIIDR